MKKEEIRQALYDILERRVISGEIGDQDGLDEFWKTVDMASRALRSIPYEALSRVTFVKEVREMVRSVLESVCPTCGGRGAIVSKEEIECSNKNCSNYSKEESDF